MAQQQEEKKIELVDKSWNKYYNAPEDQPPKFDVYRPLTSADFPVKTVDPLSLSLRDIIGNKFYAFKGTTEREREESTAIEEVTADYFEGTRFVGLFFGAGHAAPCRIMLKSLRNFYSDINLSGDRRIEICYVPFDRSRAECEEFWKTLCWPKMPLGDPRIKEIQERFEVQGVPQLVILDTKTGLCVTKNARKDIKDAGKSEQATEEVFQTWCKLYDLNKVKVVKAAQQDSQAES